MFKVNNKDTNGVVAKVGYKMMSIIAYLDV